MCSHDGGKVVVGWEGQESDFQVLVWQNGVLEAIAPGQPQEKTKKEQKQKPENQ